MPSAWAGIWILDEVGRVKGFYDVLEAVMPIIQDHPACRCIYTTTPPPDDSHPSFALLAPPLGVDLPVRPEGNTYTSEHGVFVRRVTVFDAYADGIPLYDEDKARRSLPRNHGVAPTTRTHGIAIMAASSFWEARAFVGCWKSTMPSAKGWKNVFASWRMTILHSILR